MAILLLFLALASVAPPIPCKPQFAPLDTGASSGETELDHWRKEEAGSWAGTNWVGWTHKSTRLVSVELIVRPLADKDNVHDEDRVTVEWRPKTLSYAVRCIPMVRAGRMDSAPVVNHDLEFSGPLEIALGKRRYTVRLDLVVNLSRKYSIHPHRLLLSTKATTSELVGEAAVFETGD